MRFQLGILIRREVFSGDLFDLRTSYLVFDSRVVVEDFNSNGLGIRNAEAFIDFSSISFPEFFFFAKNELSAWNLDKIAHLSKLGHEKAVIV